MVNENLKNALRFSGIDPDSDDRVVRADYSRLVGVLRGLYSADVVDDYLNQVIDYMVENQRSSAEDIQNVVYVERTPAPITKRNRTCFQSICKFDKLFNEILLRSDQDDIEDLILYSAIRYGFLIDVSLLSSWWESDWVSDLKRYKDNYWFLLDKSGNQIPHVWVPDDLTLTLISKFANSTQINRKGTWFKRIFKLFNTYSSVSGLKNQTVFLSAMRALLLSESNATIVSSCSNRKISRGLSEHAHLRRLTRRIPNQVFKIDKPKTAGSRKFAKSEINNSISRAVRHSRSKEDLLKRVDTEQLSLSSQSIMRAVFFYYQNTAEEGKKLANSGVQAIATRLCEPFDSFFDGVCPEKVSDQELLETIDRIMKSFPVPTRIGLRKSMNHYLWYLHSECGRVLHKIPRIKKDEESESHPVILYPWEYHHLHKILDRDLMVESDKSALYLLQRSKLILILSYRLGLRREEVQNLTIKNFHLSGFRELIIARSGHFSPKTLHSTRNVGISGKIENEEITYLLNYIDEVTRSGVDEDALFFHTSSELAPKTDFNRIFSLLSSAIRAITNDQLSGFHTLRHSAATNYFYQLHTKYPYCPIDEHPLGLSLMFRLGLVNYLERVKILEGGNRTRNILDQISAELGHASPDTTLSSYIHSVDLLLPEYQRDMIPNMNTRHLAWLLGVTPQAIQKTISSSDGLRHISDYRNMTHKRLRKIVPEVDTRKYFTVEEKFQSFESSDTKNPFQGLVNFLKKHEKGVYTNRQLLVAYPALREASPVFLRDSALYDFVKRQYYDIHKSQIERMIYRLVLLSPREQEYCYYRWRQIEGLSHLRLLDGKLPKGTVRQQKALDYLLRTLGPESGIGNSSSE